MFDQKDAFEKHLERLTKGSRVVSDPPVAESESLGLLEDALRQVCLDISCPEEYCNTKQLFFKIQKAHWNYEDNYREQKKLPKLKFKVFAKVMFSIGFMEKMNDFESMYEEFIRYMNKRPRCGAILLSHDFKNCLLVMGHKVRKWQFPGGKIESTDENEFQCAIRELKEELNIHITSVRPLKKIVRRVNGIKRTYFIVWQNVTPSIQNRKEVKEAKWFSIDELNSTLGLQKEFQLVAPFTQELQKRIEFLRHDHLRSCDGSSKSFNERISNKRATAPLDKRTR